MSYTRLTIEQRYEISSLLRLGYKQKDIANEIGVHKSTISRELNRNIFWRGTYKAQHAQYYADERKHNKHQQNKLTAEIEMIVREKLQEDWSPEQISGYAKEQGLFSISHERIYQFLLEDKKAGGNLYKHLRHQNKKYRKRYGSPNAKAPIRNRRFIDERPKVVDKKRRIGDWEIDTIIGKDRKQAIVSMVERKSKKTVLRKVERKTAENVKRATIKGLKPLSQFVLTITGDNGSEFAYHEAIAKALTAEFYFAHPYSSWERGCNENTNGLVRQYVPKGSDFSDIDDKNLAIIENKLNNRPRKALGYLTPNEVFFGH